MCLYVHCGLPYNICRAIWPTYQQVVAAIILYITLFTILTSKCCTGVCVYVCVCEMCVFFGCVLCVYI